MTLKKETADLKSRIELLSPKRDGPALSFPEFLNQVSPEYTWEYPHVRNIIRHLDDVTDGRIRRLKIFLPPRHLKSSLVTERYAAYRMISDPTARIIVGSYGQDLAEYFSKGILRIVSDHIPLNRKRMAVSDWETAAGGGVRAVGVGTGVTGRGADLIIIDDPVKSRQDVSSLTNRNHVHNWYTNDLFTRRNANTQIILIMTRWHQDDLAGRISSSSNARLWTEIRLPAIAMEDDPLGRQVGEALCPELFDLDGLQQIRDELGSLSFHALYQQSPLPPEGGLFQRDWFVIVETGPEDAARVRYWDTAATQGDGDYTCGVLLARTASGNFFVEDVVRGQWSPGHRNQVMLNVAKLDRDRHGHVSIRIEQEPGGAGKESAEAIIRILAGFPARAVPASGSKIVRAEPFAAQCEIGSVHLVRGPWNAAFLDEFMMFPYGTHDDQVDASCGAFNEKASNYYSYLKQRTQQEAQPDLRTIAARIDQAEIQKEIDWLEGSDYDDRRQSWGIPR